MPGAMVVTNAAAKTTSSGLIVGGIASGVPGTALQPGGSGLLDGAALGKSIDKNNVRCR